jgi:excisionase family DNA binding protein
VLQGSGARLLTVRQVAARLVVAPSTVHGLCARGLLRFVRIGASVRIDPDSLEAFLAAGGDTQRRK